LTVDTTRQWKKELSEASAKNDYQKAIEIVLGLDGVKNKIHRLLKMRMNSKDSYDTKQFKSYFGDLEFAMREFDRLGSLSGKKVVTDADFKEEEHPRGQPKNAGQFVKKGTGSAPVSAKKEEKTQGTPKGKFLYHVTYTKNIPAIKEKGLLPFQTTNWKTGKGERYGEGEVYAFEHPQDAVRWAA
jgi:hypothetical protein